MWLHPTVGDPGPTLVGREAGDQHWHAIAEEPVTAISWPGSDLHVLSFEEEQADIVPDRLVDLIPDGVEEAAPTVGLPTACGRLVEGLNPDIAVIGPASSLAGAEPSLTWEGARKDDTLCLDCFPRFEWNVSRVPPPEPDGYGAPDSGYLVVSSTEYGARLVVGMEPPAQAHWWFSSSSVVALGNDLPVFVAPVAGGMLMVAESLDDVSLRLMTSSQVVAIDTLPETPIVITIDEVAHRAAVQMSWSSFSHPDRARELTLYDLRAPAKLWTARPRFVADEIAIETDQVVVTSKRYGETRLRLADGFLIGDRGRSGQPATYPGVVPGDGAWRPAGP